MRAIQDAEVLCMFDLRQQYIANYRFLLGCLITLVVGAGSSTHSWAGCLKSTKLVSIGSEVTSLIDFNIPNSQIEQAQRQVNREVLASTLFILPRNDGEAVRAGDILRAVGAPHLHVSKQAWGAVLDREVIPESALVGVKRVAIFEMPGPEIEEKLRSRGIEVVIIDHHQYKDIDRRQAKSSLEQLMTFINWPASREDELIAINDRSYIPGLKAKNLTDQEIREVRRYDLKGQGFSAKEIEEESIQARKLIPNLENRNGIYVIEDVAASVNLLKQELAILSKNGLVNTAEIGRSKMGFSGDPAITQRLLDLNFEALGYEKGSFAQYGGGDRSASMFFGFKPTRPPKGSQELIPQSVYDEIWKAIETKSILSKR